VPYSLRERELGSSAYQTIDCRDRKAINERDRAYISISTIAAARIRALTA
jgi:hypothetical protein